MRFLGLFFSRVNTYSNRPLMNVKKYYYRGDIRAQSLIIRGNSELSLDYTKERHAFTGCYSRKFITLRGLYRGKACNCKLFCVKAGFSTLKSVESFDISRTILRKGMTFRRITRRKLKLSVNYPAESFSTTNIKT
jgi:hypothetical protein